MTMKPVPPSHDLYRVFDRTVDALPTQKCDVEIFKHGKWITCEWTPRTPESQADDGYLGTATTINRHYQIGFHAWEQNDSEFRYFCIPTNADRIHGGVDDAAGSEYHPELL